MKLYKTNKESFHKFIKGGDYKQEQGNAIHSINYISNTGDIVAYMETDSWNSVVSYKICEEPKKTKKYGKG
jgi:hypothetical protein